MRTMRAAVLERPGRVDTGPLVVRELPVPEAGPGEVLIRVRACGVCRTDLHVVEGELDVRRPGVIPGHQVVGVIEALGPCTSGPSVGDRVGVAWLSRTCGLCRFCGAASENLCERAEFTGWTVNGGFAEYIAAPAEFVYAIPSGFDDV